MREIKFRAWYESNHINPNKDKGQDFYIRKWSMGKVHTFHFNKNKVMVSGVVGVISKEVGDKCKIMQYTGLKDKNGVEIYEGDVLDVEFEGYPFLKNWKGIVKFIDGSYLIENLEGTDGEYLFDETREVEIIGNIYENPELLEVTV